MYLKNIELKSLLYRLGEDNKVSCSKKETMKHVALGLDEEKCKLLVLQQIEDRFDWQVISLDSVHTCFVKKTYININANDLKKGILEEYLDKIALRFEFTNKNEPLEVVFYNHIDHNIFEMAELEQKAKDWEIAISKILMYRIKKGEFALGFKSQYWQGF